MHKYKVGDCVIVRDDLEIRKEYGIDSIDVAAEMLEYRNKILTISNIIGWLEDSYECEEDNERYTWSADMFVGLAENAEPHITVIVPETATLNDRLRAGDNFLDMFQYSEEVTLNGN